MEGIMQVRSFDRPQVQRKGFEADDEVPYAQVLHSEEARAMHTSKQYSPMSKASSMVLPDLITPTRASSTDSESIESGSIHSVKHSIISRAHATPPPRPLRPPTHALPPPPHPLGSLRLAMMSDSMERAPTGLMADAYSRSASSLPFVLDSSRTNLHALVTSPTQRYAPGGRTRSQSHTLTLQDSDGQLRATRSQESDGRRDARRSDDSEVSALLAAMSQPNSPVHQQTPDRRPLTPSTVSSVLSGPARYPGSPLGGFPTLATVKPRKYCGLPFCVFASIVVMLSLVVLTIVMVPLSIKMLRKDIEASRKNASPEVRCKATLSCMHDGIYSLTGNGTCSCVCRYPYIGAVCEASLDSNEADPEKCKTVQSDGKTQPLGADIAQLVAVAQSFGQKVDMESLIKQFNQSKTGCAAQNDLVSLNNEKSVLKRNKRSLQNTDAAIDQIFEGESAPVSRYAVSLIERPAYPVLTLQTYLESIAERLIQLFAVNPDLRRYLLSLLGDINASNILPNANGPNVPNSLPHPGIASNGNPKIPSSPPIPGFAPVNNPLTNSGAMPGPGTPNYPGIGAIPAAGGQTTPAVPQPKQPSVASPWVPPQVPRPHLPPVALPPMPKKPDDDDIDVDDAKDEGDPPRPRPTFRPVVPVAVPDALPSQVPAKEDPQMPTQVSPSVASTTPTAEAPDNDDDDDKDGGSEPPPTPPAKTGTDSSPPSTTPPASKPKDNDDDDVDDEGGDKTKPVSPATPTPPPSPSKAPDGDDEDEDKPAEAPIARSTPPSTPSAAPKPQAPPAAANEETPKTPAVAAAPAKTKPQAAGKPAEVVKPTNLPSTTTPEGRKKTFQQVIVLQVTAKHGVAAGQAIKKEIDARESSGTFKGQFEIPGDGYKVTVNADKQTFEVS
ncbi:hypothetical protein BCR37DRAFT_395156 [Protomyces lactucae-debilis]|uniref:EGF-like domain-containing protein n=1 Tax=Protomyces lactucae-debilis TaxID=2754530 RepID=A0A1Y2EYD1_PROLT|nr:uncharacterized protein BCR37DRAFT_395156 [Protomyces lactucae-debilis]ORY76603.1 hypothetical protein BCR37DRAFT_395156 [Protomyces lactucae-debilis]